MPRSQDTAAWADKMQIEALRKMGPAKRMQLAFELSAIGWNLARENVNELYPDLTPEDRTAKFIRTVHGKDVALLYEKWRRSVKSGSCR